MILSDFEKQAIVDRWFRHQWRRNRAMMLRCELKLKAELESNLSYFGFKRLVSGAVTWVSSVHLAPPYNQLIQVGAATQPEARGLHSSTFWLNVTHLLWDTLAGFSVFSVSVTRIRLRLI